MSYDSSPQIRAEMHLDEVTAERDSLRATLAARDAEIEKLRDLLSRLEWCGYDPEGPCCVICSALGNRKEHEHEDGCELAAALSAEGGEEG